MKLIALEKTTLIDALVKRDPTLSRSRVRKWIKDGRLQVNDKVAVRDTEVEKGDSIVLDAKKMTVKGLTIVYQDEHLIVIDKPEGLLTVAKDTKDAPSAHNILKRVFGKVWPAHRLDRETSGLVLFTLSKEAKDKLLPQFQEHTIKREYIAVVEGHLKEDSGTWNCRLKEQKTLLVHPSKDGEVAITHFKVVKRSRSFTFLHLELETGKKHQIRVHSSIAGHTIVGDKKYGSMQDPFGRMALHAERLTFVHPYTEKKLNFFSPNPFV